jgi:hypothetical protein
LSTITRLTATLTASLTATSPVIPCRQQRFNLAQRRSSTLQAVMLIDLLSDRDRRMPEDQLRIPSLHSEVLQERCRAVPYIMDTNESNIVLSADSLERAHKVPRLYRQATACRKYQFCVSITALPTLAGSMASRILPHTVRAQYVPHQLK